MSKKDRENRGNPTWLKWAVTLFIAYAIFINYSGRQQQKDGAVLGGNQQKAAENTAFVSADFGTYTLPKGITIGGDVAGGGDEARCGQTATLSYSAILPDGKVIENDNGKDITLQVGVPQEDKPWAAAIPGIKKGGVRQINVLSSLYYDKDKREKLGLSESDFVNYKVEVTKITPQSSEDSITFQATDRVVGSGEIASCGMIADVHIRLWGADGKKYYDSKDGENAAPLTLNVGGSDYFYGLDRGLLGMKKGGQRTLIVPPAFAVLGSAEKNPFKDVIHTDTMLVAEVTLLDVRWK
jgi:FKBP-type peptidyl-prolyl cis-trans isomerase FkpA